MLKGPSLIAIAIFIGGIVFIAGGIILFSGVANFSDSVKDKFQVNATSGVKSMIAKTARQCARASHQRIHSNY